MRAPKFRDFIKEDKDTENIQVAILTNKITKNPVVFGNILKGVCDKLKIECHLISIQDAWVQQSDLDKQTLSVSNIDGEGTDVDFDTSRTVVFARAGAIENEVGLALLSSFERSGAFMLNDRDGMLTCNNKMTSYLAFERNNIPVPRTSIVSNEKSIDDAHERIGGKFPVIIKTMTGTQGIGVSIVKDRESLVSVIQSLWKFGAELIIQEFKKFDFDVRTLVLDGKIVGSTKRTRPKADFRSNRHMGAKTAPYKLNDDEIELVKLAARATGTTLVGVDHCIVDGELLVLECNGSPGFGSNYMGYNIKQQTPSESMSNEGIMTNIMKYIQKSNRRKPSFQLESGYIERIEIDGVGPIRAKFDTGNGTKASMFAVDKLEHDGKVARWEYKGKKFKHKVIGISSPEHVTMKETRPIVEIDIKFNNRVYPKTPFGLTSQDAKSTILINRDLLSLFRVAVNPNRKFVLSDYIEKEDKNDT